MRACAPAVQNDFRCWWLCSIAHPLHLVQPAVTEQVLLIGVLYSIAQKYGQSVNVEAIYTVTEHPAPAYNGLVLLAAAGSSMKWLLSLDWA